jgi:hypothetical protein
MMRSQVLDRRGTGIAVGAILLVLGGCHPDALRAGSPPGAERAGDGSGGGDGGAASDGTTVVDAVGPQEPETNAADARDAGPDVPVEVTSVQSVRFHLRGASGWVVTEGQQCAPLRITDLGSGRDLVMGLPQQCGCECCYLETMVTEAHPLAAQPVLTWDAREAMVFSETIACPPPLIGSGDFRTTYDQARQPIRPGRYRATFALLRGVPQGRSSMECGEDQQQTIRCGSRDCGYPGRVFDHQELCPSDATGHVDFVVPPAGDLDVDVPVFPR